MNRCYKCGKELTSTADVNGLCAECQTKEWNINKPINDKLDYTKPFKGLKTPTPSLNPLKPINDNGVQALLSLGEIKASHLQAHKDSENIGDFDLWFTEHYLNIQSCIQAQAKELEELKNKENKIKELVSKVKIRNNGYEDLAYYDYKEHHTSSRLTGFYEDLLLILGGKE
jgi:hypothetical protein